MTENAAPAGEPAGARSWAQRILSDALRAFRYRVPRLFLLAHLSLLTSTAVLIAKGVLLVVAPSWFLLANVTFGAGVIATKVMVLLYGRRTRRRTSADSARVARQLYARTGIAVLTLGTMYILMCLPTIFGERMSGTHALWAGIVIAAVAFTELILCIIGLITGRHDADPLASSIRRLNLCSALVLIVLAQSALLSAITPESQTLNGFTGIAFGALVVMLGAGPLYRHREALRTQAQNIPA
ncbi:hypothetical protein [Microbacterium sp.]|uniref:hypothetical protein n=1 Tax=Microbacterium sp. TaxID=51671 RepID=UPI00273328FF|nr:hypothetical protein [Microbacterium sp.]MDP3951680.1 hypothetical protein [Microbacterium sp.]